MWGDSGETITSHQHAEQPGGMSGKTVAALCAAAIVVVGGTIYDSWQNMPVGQERALRNQTYQGYKMQRTPPWGLSRGVSVFHPRPKGERSSSLCAPGFFLSRTQALEIGKKYDLVWQNTRHEGYRTIIGATPSESE